MWDSRASRCEVLTSSKSGAVSVKLCVFTLHREGPPHKSRLEVPHVVFVGKLGRIDKGIGEVEIGAPTSVLEQRAQVDDLMDAVDFAVDGRDRAANRKSEFVVVKLFLSRNFE